MVTVIFKRGGWIQKAIKKPGALTESAKKEGLSIAQYCKKDNLSSTSKKRCNLAKTLKSFKKGGSVKYKGSGTKDACYNKVKSRYKVWPSAYASAALSKCRKIGASNWGVSKKQKGGTFDKEKKEGLRGWLNRNNGSGWTDCNSGKPCGRQEGEKRKYPACRPTLAACKKYKKPTGKTSSKRYNWKKK